MSRNVGIVGYGMGNVTSLQHALTALGAEVLLAERPVQLKDCSHIILPGVGAFPKGMEQLQSLGFAEELYEQVRIREKALLGICLGMQLLASIGKEHQICAGLGLLPGRVTLLDGAGLRVPHIGWNDTTPTHGNRLLPSNSKGCFYYVHSYQLIPENTGDISMLCEYGQSFAAGIERDNIFGVQFHPEKSHSDGLALLKRFMDL